MISNAIHDFQDAWDEANHSLQGASTRTTLKARHRLTSCVRDVIAFYGLLDKTHGRVANLSSETMNRLGVAFKAMYFFVRALQDAAYCILNQLVNNTSVNGGSMSKCKSAKNPVGVYLNKELPQYLSWFFAFKAIRDDLKLGRTTGAGYEESPDGKIGKISLSIHITHDDPTSIDIEKEISIDEIHEALIQGSGLLNSITRLCHCGKC